MNESEIVSTLSFLEKILGEAQFFQRSKEACFFCVFCSHHKKKLSVNLETHQWHCWVCGKAGRSLLPIIKRKGSSERVEEYIRKFSNKNSNIIPDTNNENFKLELPKEYVPLVDCKNSFIGKAPYEYLIKKRNLTDEDILFHKIGICIGGEHHQRILLPSFDGNGEINFYTTRNIYRGYYNPEVPRNYKNTIIMNELNIDWDSPVTIVEGFFDMLKAGRNTIPLFSSILSEGSKLFFEIVKNQVPVYLALDTDAEKKSIKIAKSFISYDIPVYNIDVAPFKDVGELSKEEFKKRYDKAYLVDDKNMFLRKLRMLE